MLTTAATTTARHDDACSAAATGLGYWTCDVHGGCSDCRSIARSANDRDLLNEWDAERAAHPTA